MRIFATPVSIIAIVFALFANATPAHAAATWVSAAGHNTGACPATAPCATFAYALTQTPPGGSINVLSSGDFGPLVINKSVSIVADGALASISGVVTCPGGTAGICINAAATDTVSLHGLTIDMQGTAHYGISVVGAVAALHVQHSFIRNGGRGISYKPTNVSKLFVSDSTIADNSAYGIWLKPTAFYTSVFNRVQVENNGTGLYLDGSAAGTVTDPKRVFETIRDSAVAGNTSTGIAVVASFGIIEHSSLIGNGVGVTFNGGTLIGHDGTFGANSFAPSDSIWTFGNNATFADQGNFSQSTPLR